MNRRAFALIELMTILVILVVFLFVSSRVFTMTMRQMHAVPAAANRMASLEQIRTTLARDLWNAVDLREPDAEVLLLLDAKGLLVTWRKSTDGVLTRSTVDTESRWQELGDLAFKREPGSVVLTQQLRTWTLPTPLLREEKP